MKAIIRTFVKRPVTTTMLILIVISFGIMSLLQLKLELMPNMDMPIAIVYSSYSGAGSEEMENLVTKPLENVLATISGVENMTSTSSEGVSMVMLEFAEGTDLDNASLDMREQIDLIEAMLPEDASEPMVLKIDINSMTSFQFGVSSNSGNLTELQNIVEDRVVPRLEKQSGVASVSVAGGDENEVVVEFIPDKLRGYGMSESTIQGLLYSENKNTPTGSVEQGNSVLALRVKGEFESIEDIKKLPITTPTGQLIYIRDVANVYEAPKEKNNYSYIGESPAVTLTIQKESDANTVEVSDELLEEMEAINNQVSGIELIVLQDPGEYIRASISGVASSAIVGGIIAIIILFLFLKDVRTTIIVGLAIPISMVSTFFLMNMTGISINIMSLGGLTLGVGMLVDNSIVVIESIYRKLEQGESKLTSAIDGASEVAMSVIASTLTTIVVFLPISFQGGLVAQIFNSLSFTISFSLFSSLFVALTFVPMASALFLVKEDEKLKVGIVYKLLTKFNEGFTKLESGYKKLLKIAINKRKSVYLVALAFVVLTGLMFARIGFEYMPETDEGMLMATASLPNGTDVDVSIEKGLEISKIFSENENVDFVTLSTGSSGTMSIMTGASSDSVSFTIILKSKDERNATIKEVENQLIYATKDVAGAKISVSNPSSVTGSATSGVSITLKGDENSVLAEIAETFEEVGESFDGVSSVSTSVQEKSKQVNINVDRDKAMAYGVTSSNIASTIDTAINGKTATTLKVNGDELDVVIRQDPDAFNYLMDVENILIPTASGVNVPLTEVAEIEEVELPSSIARENQQRYVTVTFVSDGSASNIITSSFEKYMAENQAVIMPSGYTWEYSGSTEELNETFGSLGLALIMAIVLVYMVMAAEFESLRYPFIVMFSIPMAITGGVFGIGLVGENFNVTSFLGLIMLSGLVINNAIVLIDYINLLMRERGKALEEAILIAGPVRLRPIVMSVLTTSIGLLPMAFSSASGAELMRGLAFIVIFGLLFSTLVTLILIPALYSTMYIKNEKRLEKKEIKYNKKLEKIREKNKGNI